MMMRTADLMGRMGVAVCVLGAVWGTASQCLAAEAEDVVARGQGVVVTREELDQLVVEQKVLFQTRGQAVAPEQEARMEALTLDRLILRRLLAGRATDADRARAKELVEKGIADHKGRLGSPEAYRRQVQASGASVELYEARLLEQAVADQVVTRELGAKVTVTDEQVKAYWQDGLDVAGREVKALVDRMEPADRETVFYRDATNRLELIRRTNLGRLERPAEARVRILVQFTADPVTGKAVSEGVREEKRKRIEAWRKEALDGGDFGLIAAANSEEPGAKSSRGEYVAREPELLPELRGPVFSLPLKELSEVIVTERGFYVVQVLERREGGKVPLEAAAADIRALLRQQEIEKLLPGWAEELKKASGVRVLLPAASR